MENEQSAGKPRARGLISAKRVLLALGGLLAIAIAAVGFCVVSDLHSGGPAPEAVRRIEAEKKRANPVATAQEIKPAALANANVKPEPLIPADLKALPVKVAAEREDLNKQYAALIAKYEALEVEAPGLSFEETRDRNQAVMTGTSSLTIKLRDDWGGDEKARVKDKVYMAIHQRLFQIFEKSGQMYTDNLVRHEKWEELAKGYEMGEMWPDAQYYWHRLGGWEGYKRLACGAIYRRTKGVPVLGVITRILPHYELPKMIG